MRCRAMPRSCFFFFQAEDGIRDIGVTGVQTCALPIFIATMATIFGVAEEGVEITNAIQSLFTPLSAISFMVFSLLYAPCCAAIGAVKRETNSAKWAWFVVIYTTALAWVVSVLIYQVGRLMGFN